MKIDNDLAAYLMVFAGLLVFALLFIAPPVAISLHYGLPYYAYEAIQAFWGLGGLLIGVIVYSAVTQGTK